MQQSPKERLILLAAKKRSEVTFEDVLVDPPASGFLIKVTVFGVSYEGSLQRRKRLAENAAAAHALYELRHPDVAVLAEAAEGFTADSSLTEEPKAAPKRKPKQRAEAAVAVEPVQVEGGWQSLVKAESKWEMQQSPKERLLMYGAKKKVDVVFEDLPVQTSEIGFLVQVSTGGQEYVGEVHRRKRLAENSAAAHALYAMQHPDVHQLAALAGVAADPPWP
jgi:dsRNA-specific ribonuclease